MGIGATTGAGRLLANPLIISVGVRGVTKRQSCIYTCICARGTLLVCIGLYGLFSSIMEITDDDGRSAWPLATIGTQEFVSKYRCVSDRYDLRIPRGYARCLQDQRKSITFAAEFKSLTRLHLPRHGRYLRSSDILVLDVFARRDLQSVRFQP